MATIAPAELVERIWERDPTVWTGRDEAQWLGWLDEPLRMRERAGELVAFADDAVERFEDVVLLGVGGASVAAEVLRQAFRVESLHVLDTTHPRAIRRLESGLDLERTLFLAASKSGGTVETLSLLTYFWERSGQRGESFAAITDPGSPLDDLARERGFGAVFHGEPTIAGPFSALSAFGLVPAALMGVDLERFLAGAVEAIERCRAGEDGNPGLELGLALGEGWREGRDKLTSPNPHGLGLWVEQLAAQSLGKDGKGIVPAPDESPKGADRLPVEIVLDDPYELAGELFRWQFAVAVAASMLAVDPFERPDVQETTDRTGALLAADEEPAAEGGLDELLASAQDGDYVAILAFVDPTPAAEERLVALADRARERTGCVVTGGFGPAYLHSTGQLHKGGPASGLFVQVVDDTGPELEIPGRCFGFARLLRAQAAADLAALRERGRRIVRVRLEDL